MANDVSTEDRLPLGHIDAATRTDKVSRSAAEPARIRRCGLLAAAAVAYEAAAMIGVVFLVAIVLPFVAIKIALETWPWEK